MVGNFFVDSLWPLAAYQQEEEQFLLQQQKDEMGRKASTPK